MIMIALIILALLAAAAFWFLSGRTVTDVSQVPWIGHFAAAPATIAVPPGA
jgi:hypothetical protein